MLKLFSCAKGRSVRTCLKCAAILSLLCGVVGLLLSPKSVCAGSTQDQSALAKAISYHILGASADLVGDSDQAVGFYKQSLAYNPNSYLTQLRLGAHYARLGMLDDALAHLSQVPVLNPSEIQSRYLLALIYSAQKKFSQAAQEYEVILKTLSHESPENLNLYFYLGQLYYAQHQYDQATIQFLKILELNPTNVEIVNFIGGLYVEQGKELEAISMFKRTLQLDPNNHLALNSLGYLYAEQGNHLDEAQRLILRALEIFPQSAAYLDSLGWVYYKQGRYQKALEVLQQAEKIAQDPIIFEHLGDVYLALKDIAQAKAYWSKALKVDPQMKKILEKINRIDRLQGHSQRLQSSLNE